MMQDRLIETAIDQFGRLGFDGASTRDIARASETAMSSITYHFGGKQGLYLACADHIAAKLRERHAPSMEMTKDAQELDRETAIERCLAIVDMLAQTMLHPDSEHWARFIVREQQAPTEAFERLYEGAMQAVLTGVRSLLERARPDIPRDELGAMAMLIFGQSLVLRAARATVCKALGATQLDEAEGALLRRHIRSNTLAILSGETQ